MCNQHIYERRLTLLKLGADGTAFGAYGSVWLQLVHAFSIADSLLLCQTDAYSAELCKRSSEVGLLMSNLCIVAIHYFCNSQVFSRHKVAWHGFGHRCGIAISFY